MDLVRLFFIRKVPRQYKKKKRKKEKKEKNRKEEEENKDKNNRTILDLAKPYRCKLVG